MSGRTSHAFGKFLESLNETNQYLDRHYDPSWLRLADTEEREQGIDLLLERVRTRDDTLAAEALAELGCARAVADLAALADRVQGTGGASAVNAALLRIDGGPSRLAKVADDARAGERVAIRALAGRDEAEAREALLAIMESDDAALRAAAFESLVETWGLGGLRRDPLAPLNTIESQLRADQQALRTRATERIRSLDRSLSDGRTAVDLGLVFDASADGDFQNLVGRSIQDRGHPFPPSLGGVAGHAREWLEALMAIRLDPDIRDPRAARFLGDLGAVWSVPVLLEAVRQAPNEDAFVVAAREALATLAERGPGTVRARASERP